MHLKADIFYWPSSPFHSVCVSCVEELTTKKHLKHLKGRTYKYEMEEKINVDTRKMKGPQIFARLVHGNNMENILGIMLLYVFFCYFVILLVLLSYFSNSNLNTHCVFGEKEV